jgi:hypothetical protein
MHASLPLQVAYPGPRSAAVGTLPHKVQATATAKSAHGALPLVDGTAWGSGDGVGLGARWVSSGSGKKAPSSVHPGLKRVRWGRPPHPPTPLHTHAHTRTSFPCPCTHPLSF